MLNLNIIFYEKYISELQHKIKKMQMKIKDQDINKLNEDSLKYFKAFVSKNEYKHLYETKDTYIKNFCQFIKGYPVVGTTSSSIYNTKGTNFQYDYLIIDEASQMNVYEGLSTITFAKNIIVVGDERQLQAVTNGFKQNTVGKIDMTQGFLTLFKRIGDVSTIMLKEHYRCDRSIINFCNQFFYNKQLKIHTEFNGKTMDIHLCESQAEVTMVGNKIKDRAGVVISPYKDNKYETIYSYQGREAKHVYFAIDKNYLNSHTRNTNLINVAVSRAQKTLTLISKDFSADSSIVGDLFKYIKYYTHNELEYEPKTLFVKLYKKKKLGKLSPAEVDVEELLKLIYRNDKSIDHLYGYRLSDLVNHKIEYDDEQLDYILNQSHRDFLIYSTANKEPILVIEVDGNSFHDKEEQKYRYKMKNEILARNHLPLLRLNTKNESNEKSSIIQAIKEAKEVENKTTISKFKIK
ncbi:DUF2726 domain-containing protein [Mollicutes bacterium LVI A0039]|nr:DUF2726 domain-containing protein [Mollicutes bacterium LVI A0039]